jgi:hypothetical protein
VVAGAAGWLARPIAMMPARIGSGKVGQAAIRMVIGGCDLTSQESGGGFGFFSTTWRRPC